MRHGDSFYTPQKLGTKTLGIAACSASLVDEQEPLKIVASRGIYSTESVMAQIDNLRSRINLNLAGGVITSVGSTGSSGFDGRFHRGRGLFTAPDRLIR